MIIILFYQNIILLIRNITLLNMNRLVVDLMTRKLFWREIHSAVLPIDKLTYILAFSVSIEEMSFQ